MDIEKSAELTGMALDQAVVRVKWPNAKATKMDSEGDIYILSNRGAFAPIIDKGAEQPEAWANAADKVIEAEYSIVKGKAGFDWRCGIRVSLRVYSTRELALESAKLDYIKRQSENV